MGDRFDVVVIGAGPAGSSAAYNLAKRGFKVALIERGRKPGSKNMFGGRVYAKPLEEAFDGLDKAPIHRWVVKERLSIVNGEEYVTLEYSGSGGKSFTTYLTDLTDWMASKAVDAGATLITEVVVDRLLIRDGRVAGIVSGSDELEADVVVDAEGVNRLVLEKSGLVERLTPRHVALGVKEVIKVEKGDIEKFFGLGEDEGLAWVFMGSVSDGLPGGGFFYTNRDSLSLGLVIYLEKAVEGMKRHIYDMVEDLRIGPLFSKYVENGRVMEYSAHMIPADPRAIRPPRLVWDGLLVTGDAAGLLINMGYTYRGVDTAAYSGMLAAKAIEEAEGDYSASSLKRYEEMLMKSYVGRDLEKFKGVHDLYMNPRLFKEYPILLTGLLRRLYEFDYGGYRLSEAFSEARRGLVSLPRIILDLLEVYRKL